VNHIKGATTAIEREEGALRAIKKDGRFKILDTRYTNNIEENAYGITLELLETHRNLGGIMAMNEVSTVGVARALRDKKRSDVRLVGFDNSLFEVKLIEEGIIDATVIQQPFNMGYLAVRAARTANTGKRLEPFIDTGSLLITVDNMYHPEIQKSLFPFAEREARQ
jgi:ribose transport system substrate-binding protein